MQQIDSQTATDLVQSAIGALLKKMTILQDKRGLEPDRDRQNQLDLIICRYSMAIQQLQGAIALLEIRGNNGN